VSRNTPAGQQTAAGRAQQASNRAKEQQRDAVRQVLRDPDALAVIARDPAFRRMVAQEVTAERHRQEAAERQAAAEQARAMADEYAPRQVSQVADPWANDFEHSREFMTAAQNGENIARLRAEHEQRQRQAAAEQAERRARMWDTGDFEAVRRGLSPRTGDALYDDANDRRQFYGPGMGLPPKGGQRSVPLPDPEAMREREAAK
jgi:hypothetical protein